MLTEKVPEEAQALRLSDKHSIQAVGNSLKDLLKQLKETMSEELGARQKRGLPTQRTLTKKKNSKSPLKIL